MNKPPKMIAAVLFASIAMLLFQSCATLNQMASALVNLKRLQFKIGGANRNPARLSLDAQPRVSTPLGTITYPGRILIVDKEFR